MFVRVSLTTRAVVVSSTCEADYYTHCETYLLVEIHAAGIISKIEVSDVK